MRAKAPHRACEQHDVLGGRVERVIVGVLLGLTGLAAMWWACSWWWRAARVEVVSATPAPVGTAVLAPSPHPRTLPGLLPQRIAAVGEDAGAEAAVGREQAPPSNPAYGSDQGHGSEAWSRAGSREPRDFEPRYTLDGGGMAEPAAVAADETSAFH